ncbi:MAG: hypothetical protein JST06_03545 [Bacteroidetes bacterium]|nr:hypothetical protein [Bacteroidota bacterium]MBS1630845.1 hypothetical protein [Bacteroidota bacterium]
MMRNISFGLLAAALLAVSCNNGNTHSVAAKSDSGTHAVAITLNDFPSSPEFADASLGIAGMKAIKQGADSVKLSVAFDVKNYELKAQTSDAAGKQCSNSAEGQHIHFILDNKPYVALYEPKYELVLPVNSEHYLLCFLSRSYHESLKTKKAAVLAHFRIDASGKLEKLADSKSPMLFYSRPKGNYLGKDTSKVMLDFYPTLATLGADYKVKADISNSSNGRTASFTLDQWAPKFIEGLGTGDCSVTLTLLDKNGTPVPGENTSVTRKFKLAASEPMP